MSESQGTSATPTAPSRMSTAVIVSIVALVSLVLGAIVVLTALDRPVDNVLVIVGAVIAPTIAALLGYSKLESSSAVLRDVSVKVNGRLDALLTAKTLLEDQVRSVGHTPITMPAPRHAAENPPIPAPSTQELNNG
jgi:hypothetical protein